MLTDKIAADMKEAMRAKDAARLSTLRLLKSAIEYHKIEKKQEQITDADVTAVITCKSQEAYVPLGSKELLS